LGSTTQLSVQVRDGDSEVTRPRNVRFISPVLDYGYPPAIEEYNQNELQEKPLFLYLPGFDSTFLCPFFQFPELSTLFDVRCMTAGSDDRSTFDELKETVVDFLRSESSLSLDGIGSKERRPVYLAGESFGGILATEVAAHLLEEQDMELKGLTLVNAATSFDRSVLGEKGPDVAKLPFWRYPTGLLELLPLFTDRYSIDQLLLILKAEGLPSVINTAAREAYLGRVAFSLPFVLPVLSQDTFQWRLDSWLREGCERRVCHRLSQILRNGNGGLRTLLVAGENDQALPSVEEANRLATLWPDAKVHVVPDAGHASTCGTRVDLAALLRNRFEELRHEGGRTEMSPEATFGEGMYFGMEKRYDGQSIGLSPLQYWSDQYFQTI
jgi:pimeloyl-ACP methyl ester carboxylesterase